MFEDILKNKSNPVHQKYKNIAEEQPHFQKDDFSFQKWRFTAKWYQVSPQIKRNALLRPTEYWFSFWKATAQGFSIPNSIQIQIFSSQFQTWQTSDKHTNEWSKKKKKVAMFIIIFMK